MRCVVFTGAGGPEVIAVEERPDPEPGTEDVLVQVRHAGLNPADVVQRKGNYPAPPGSPADVPGLEVAGTVVACGSRVTTWRVGDRVFGLVGGGGLASRVVVHERAVARIPDELDDRAAAAVPEAFITAHDAICTQAALRPGETLLVHGPSGGVGSAAVQIGVATGATVLGVTRSDDAAALVAELGAQAVPDDGFAAAVKERTGGRGADVVLELVGAPHFPGNLEALASKGRIIIVGVGAGARIELPLNVLMGRRASIRGTVLRARPLEEKGAAVRAFEREVVPLLASGRVRPLIDTELPVDRVVEAFARLEGTGKRGKVLVGFDG
jgi:putative PIG3 family NAD(P)H quinone oxidoreductase